MPDFLARIDESTERTSALEADLANPEISRQPGRYQKLAKELARLRPVVETGAAYRAALLQITESEIMASDDDAEIADLARSELEELKATKASLEKKLRELLIPRDPNDDRNAIFEIRAGTGGEEASLFAADLFRMYSRYAENLGWKIEVLSQSATDAGGFKEVIAMIEGEEVFSRFKYERGVHRVQRVPTTESQGRIHTSTVTVAVMPEAEEVDIEIDPADLRIDVMRAGGPGGQSVNTTDSAVRITHGPTGLVVQCQDEKSQHKNKAKAMKVLRSRLYELEEERLAAERSEARRAQVGTGERSEKIRTYNFPQNRVTDHRAGITLHKLDHVMEGELAELLDAVAAHLVSEIEFS
ncbi:MAG: peptide chain release factor 1 [Myxococcota bacterium]|jgi:peptide chain release factor 1